MDGINSDTLSVKDGDWEQVHSFLNSDQSLSCAKIHVHTEYGELLITGDNLEVAQVDTDE